MCLIHISTSLVVTRIKKVPQLIKLSKYYQNVISRKQNVCVLISENSPSWFLPGVTLFVNSHQIINPKKTFHISQGTLINSLMVSLKRESKHSSTGFLLCSLVLSNGYGSSTSGLWLEENWIYFFACIGNENFRLFNRIDEICKLFYSPKEHFIFARTDVEELAASFRAACTVPETEEISILLHYNYFQRYPCLYRICDVRLVSELFKVPYLLGSRLNTCAGGTDLAGKSKNVHSHFFSPLAHSAVSAALKDYHLHGFFSLQRVLLKCSPRKGIYQQPDPV